MRHHRFLTRFVCYLYLSLCFNFFSSHCWTTDEDGYFHIGSPEGNHQFEIIYENEIVDTISIEFLPRETNEIDFLLDQDILQGDVNYDNNLDVLDIIIIINIIIGNQEPTSQEMLVSDMNEDGDLNIQDIILLVNEILSINW